MALRVIDTKVHKKSGIEKFRVIELNNSEFRDLGEWDAKPSEAAKKPSKTEAA
ncbi:hypothetical protein [uncultured Alistipes sp.]|uniref:hypothetical protein n=1 Tax=uncultured Alistipes sp. TaxID=538949 RepID=UPI00259526B2|nr:hypothetical protein [uncultured Alistipes sp.]